MYPVIVVGEGTAAVDFAGLVTALGGMISMADIIAFLALGIGVAGVFFLGWMGVRKLTKMIQTAAKSGKIKV